MKKYLLVSAYLVALLLVVNNCFAWWIFDPDKEAVYEEWLKTQSNPPAAQEQSDLSGELQLQTVPELQPVFQELVSVFQSKYPLVQIQQTTASNLTLGQPAKENQPVADILVGSSERLAKQELLEKRCDWYLKFATNEIVLLYTPHSKFADQVNQSNWTEILTREETRYGYLDPRIDEVGSRTVFTWQLAEQHYQIKDLYLLLVKKVRSSNVFPDADSLLTALNKGELDYSFHYRSFALEHKLKFIPLPPQVNLGDVSQTSQYQKARFKLKDEKSKGWIIEKGEPINNLLTIPRGAQQPKLALVFLEFCLDKEGTMILRQQGLMPLLNRQAVIQGEFPAQLRKYLAGELHEQKTKNLPKPEQGNNTSGTKLELPQLPNTPQLPKLPVIPKPQQPK